MNRLKALPIALLLVIVFSCVQDDDQSPYLVNNSVLPGDFLADKQYTQLVLEVVFVEGNEPTTTAINNLVTFLGERLNKPLGITSVIRSIPTPGKTTIDVSDLRDLEKIHRQRVTSGNVLTAWLFFADGEYSGSTSSSKVLGVAYGSSSIAVFEKTVNQLSGGLNQPRTASLETTILEHEFGHILGLVNNGTSMVAPHQDSDHTAHCSATDCLMYYKAETQLIGADITGKGIPTLDKNCLADLKAAGGK
jgi:hypothetical protein